MLALRDRELRVLHRPGHRPTDTVFWDERRRILLAGDHLLARISSNAMLSRPLTDENHGGRPRPLLAYADSLRRTRELPAKLVLGGHGPPMGEHISPLSEVLGHLDLLIEDGSVRELAGNPVVRFEAIEPRRRT